MRKARFRAWDMNEEKLIKCNQDWFSQHGNGMDDLFEIEGFEVMQCTGIKDKHGKYIYENDYVKLFSKKTKEFRIEQVTWNGIGWDFGEWDEEPIPFEGCQIVGNIYEDWDLIA